MSALHEAARRVVAAWAGLRPTRPSWVNDVNAAVLALGEALKAEPQDAELSAALGWPGGISKLVLDRKVLLQKVAALMQDKLWEDHRVRHLWDHTMAHQPEQAGCETEADCSSQPWCRISGECHRKQPEPAQEPITRIFGTLPVHDAQQPEPAQEPVAWRWKIGNSCWQLEDSAVLTTRNDAIIEPLYTAPQPQRPPLTNEEMRTLADKYLSCQPESYEVSGVFELSRAIERKVRGE